jgi:hypothetical protein
VELAGSEYGWYELGRRLSPSKALLLARKLARRNPCRTSIPTWLGDAELEGSLARLRGSRHRIFDAHLLILEDRWLMERASSIIQEQRVNVEFAVQEVLDPVRQALSRVEDGYLRERRTDVDDIEDRLLRNLLGQRGASTSRNCAGTPSSSRTTSARRTRPNCTGIRSWAW